MFALYDFSRIKLLAEAQDTDALLGVCGGQRHTEALSAYSQIGIAVLLPLREHTVSGAKYASYREKQSLS